MTQDDNFILTLSCKDTIGIVSAVSTFLAENKCFIIESAQWGDLTTHNFFMRVVFAITDKDINFTNVQQKFIPIAKRFSMDWDLRSRAKKSKLILMVSKQGHCLNDLLHKLQEEKIVELFNRHQADLLVLARYMQIFSPWLIEKIYGKAINIHHSFLPGFKGADPYRQAFNRGVKIIGATAHYVSNQLDEGPIIEQEVIRVDHIQGPEQLLATGMDIESLVLTRAVKCHIERRVFINGNKTVVFK